ncbi:ATP-grasp fold amidoligase family protein [Carnimonas nigrificans]|uniref:ATP-grasp fold amidoligase family protein n=1 Tax=Carnimonas nigrificans TaxID=64323 RepID=UPI00046F137D|nr:ATP-grasp fold amidoligase family protein [Carnimonas nigrificans]
MKKHQQDVTALLQALAQSKEQVDREKEQKRVIANQLAAAAQQLSAAERQGILEKMSELLTADELTEKFTRLLSQSKIQLTNAASFQQLLVQATRRRQLFNFQPEWKLNNKRHAYKFIDSLGVRRPKIYAFNQVLSKILPKKGTVLKPENGSSSHGVFIFDEQGGAFEVRTGESLRTADSALEKAASLMEEGKIKKDSWLLEEFIGDFEKGKPSAPVDLKFYCFYGEVGFVLEVERGNQTRYCEWMPDGQLAATGRYEGKTFIGNGFSNQQLETAKRISKTILTPFIRIDFIRSKNTFSFGEFTPRPGQFSSFNEVFDRYLGECYLNAEGRLFKDMYN